MEVAARTGRLPVRGRTGNFEPSATPYLRRVPPHGKSQLPGALAGGIACEVSCYGIVLFPAAFGEQEGRRVCFDFSVPVFGKGQGGVLLRSCRAGGPTMAVPGDGEKESDDFVVAFKIG